MAQLPKTAFSGLDYNNIVSDVRALIAENPDYNSNWDDFLNSNAGKMLVDLFAYITDNLATRIDWIVNENFIGTATQKRSIMKMLKLIGYNFTLASAASVDVSLNIDGWFSNPFTTTSSQQDYYITPPYSASTGTLNIFSFPVTGTDGSTKTFELIPYDETQFAYDYKTGVKINCGDISSPTLTFPLKFKEGIC